MIGKFIPIKGDECLSYRKEFIAKTMEMCGVDAYRGEKEDGEQYHVYTKYWRFEPVWNGDGLPQVGCKCEVNDERTDSWSLVDSVLAHACVHGRDVAVFQIANYIGYSPADRFRSIRTEEERRREESIEAIRLATAGADQDKPFNEAIYGAIAAGKIPGVRLTDD